MESSEIERSQVSKLWVLWRPIGVSTSALGCSPCRRDWEGHVQVSRANKQLPPLDLALIWPCSQIRRPPAFKNAPPKYLEHFEVLIGWKCASNWSQGTPCTPDWGWDVDGCPVNYMIWNDRMDLRFNKFCWMNYKLWVGDKIFSMVGLILFSMHRSMLRSMRRNLHVAKWSGGTREGVNSHETGSITTLVWQIGILMDGSTWLTNEEYHLHIHGKSNSGGTTTLSRLMGGVWKLLVRVEIDVCDSPIGYIDPISRATVAWKMEWWIDSKSMRTFSIWRAMPVCSKDSVTYGWEKGTNYSKGGRLNGMCVEGGVTSLEVVTTSSKSISGSINCPSICDAVERELGEVCDSRLQVSSISGGKHCILQDLPIGCSNLLGLNALKK